MSASSHWEILEAAFAKKRVAVTGHTGFKGSWLCLLLKELGAEVSGYSDAVPTMPSLFESAEISKTVSDTRGDMRDRDRLSLWLKTARPDFAFHLAAQPLVRDSYEDPVGTFETNFMGTVNFLDSCRALDTLKAAIVVTSDKCYFNQEHDRPYEENDRLGGKDPYSGSKAAAELAVETYRKSFFSGAGAKVSSVRAGNVIGGGDWSKDRLVPDIVRASFNGTPLMLRNPKSTRPWQHVLDSLGGYLLLAARMSESATPLDEGWNFGPDSNEVLSAQTLAARMIESLKLPCKVEHLKGEGGKPEAKQLTLSSQKAKTRLGWSPIWKIDQTVQKTADWYRDLNLGKSAKELCLRDINDWRK